MFIENGVKQMSEYKYEPVFGDQLAFDGMMPDCEFIVGTYGYKIKDGKCFYCEKYNHKYGWSPTGDAAKAISPVCAMRRIIAEPNRWTVEDQKAGRLREEWCIKALRYNSQSGSKVEAIYDALLSGDLPAPVKGE